MKKRKVLVLGSGPAGLLVAHAATLMGYEPCIVTSETTPSKIGGAQYLHKEIPELVTPKNSHKILYVRYGSEAEYSRKIYGADFDPKQTSWSKFPDVVYGWPLRSVYYELWQRYAKHLVRVRVKPGDTERQSGFDFKFSTIPRQHITPNHEDYEWRSEECVIVPGKPQAGVHIIIYSGERGVPWYRYSCLWGHASYEYPGDFTDNVLRTVLTKPVSTDAPAPEGIHLVGRYGKWQKGVLVDHAFTEAMAILQGQG